MKSRARLRSPGAFRNRHGRSDMRTKRRSRRMFFEALESRQLLAVAPGDEGTIWETFQGNYIPANEYKSATPNFLTAPSTANDLDIAINYLKANAASFGVVANDFNNYIVTDQYTNANTGITHIYLQQKFNGLPVADTSAAVHITAGGQIIAASANFLRNLGNNNAPVPAQPSLSAMNALIAFGQQTGREVFVSSEDFEVIGGQSEKVIYNGTGAAELSSEPIPIELHYVPKTTGGVELAWKISGRYPGLEHIYETSIGAHANQRMGQTIRLIDLIEKASYNVFPQPVDDILDGNRRVVIDPQDSVASPFGWHDTNGVPGPEFFDSRGNNASVKEDLNGDLAGGALHFPSQTLDFNDFLFLPAPPATYTQASITNVFYWINLVHDISARHGFDEASGNFQIKNYSTEGKGGDPVFAFTQSTAALNNAFMATLPEGQPPLLVMGIVDFPNPIPDRDTGLDSLIITHEYTHGISNRLTGGPFNIFALDALQSGGMGEGWSDWMALLLTIDPGDVKETPRVLSPWAFGFPGGIRRQPYSYDMAIDPLTLDDFNGFDIFGFPNSEVHNAGEIWASALWDLSWLMIERYGFDSDWYEGDGGNNRVMDLVLEGMKLQPANPSFIDARDAILAADLALNNNANYELIWQAFSRRGFGVTAFDGGGAASDVVVEDFTNPQPLTRVSGRVIDDANGNGVINTGELGLAGWTVYVDVNKNGVLDLGDRSTVSAADGSYTLPINSAGSHVIRQIVQPGYVATNPTSSSFTVNLTIGANVTRNFLNRQLPGGIKGTKFNDLDGNGVRDQGEPGIAGIMIYVDLNKDGKIGVLEPAATTDANGNYTIPNVKVGQDYHVREVPKPGLIQTFPDPADAATLGGAQIDVDVVSGVFTTGINFGNQLALDFGDAPVSYGTLLANNGPRHGVIAGYGLTLENPVDPTDPSFPDFIANVIDAEPNGQPHFLALGDDVIDDTTTPPRVDDENGVQFLAGLVPGEIATIRVGVRTGGFSPGRLHAWVDFNRDGDFLDPNEKLVFTSINTATVNTSAPQLTEGTYTLGFRVPAGATLGNTFARFRYGFETNLGPLGAALGGEVEDHTTNILLDQAVASPDDFPDRTRVPPDPFIQLNSDFADNSLDVLRNDFGTSTDPTPEIFSAIDTQGTTATNDDVEVVFTAPNQVITTAAGGTVKFVGPTLPLQYRPRPGYTGPDSFQYRVTAGGTTSAFATVSIDVSPSDPVAVDDILLLAPGSGATDIFVLANDLAVPSQAISIISDPSPLSAIVPQGLTLTRTLTGDRLVLNRAIGTPAATFTGTVRFAYTIDDAGDPTTAPSTAVVTLEIIAPTPPLPASYLATFKTRYLAADPNNNNEPILGPGISQLFLADNEFFWVELVVQDPANAGDNPPTTGVDSAYIDMLINSFPNVPSTPVLVEPVLNGAGTNFVIQFEPSYDQNRRSDATFSVPGTVQEIGAARGFGPATGNGEVVVMRVMFRAHDGGSVIIQADHADSPQLPINLFDPTATPLPGPVPISDDQVFIPKAGTLTIIPDGAEGEFTNRNNVYDVNGDSNVNQTDILVLVNDLSLTGPRSLNQLAIALSGLLPAGYVDVNIDAQVNSSDILNLLNYLTLRGATGSNGGSGEGEGEGVGTSASATGGSSATLAASADSSASGDVQPFAALLNQLALEQSQQEESAEGESASSEPVIVKGSTSDDDEPVSESTASTGGEESPSTGGEESPSTGGDSQSTAVDSEAADELFASMSSFRQRLLSRRLARG